MSTRMIVEHLLTILIHRVTMRKTNAKKVKSYLKHKKIQWFDQVCNKLPGLLGENLWFVTRSSSKGRFYCKICRKDVSIKHKGVLDIERNPEGKTHRQRVLSARSHSQLSFKSTTDPIHNKVTAAGVRHTVMLAHHNAALCLADHIWSYATKELPWLRGYQELTLCKNKNSMYFELCPGSLPEGWACSTGLLHYSTFHASTALLLAMALLYNTDWCLSVAFVWCSYFLYNLDIDAYNSSMASITTY